MATTKGQRIGIWIIAAFMAIGTIGSFAIIVLANDNASRDQDRYTALLADYQAEAKAQNDELSSKYYEKLNQFSSRVGEFNADDVKELKTENLVEGDGEELTADSTFSAYYIGWNPKGKIFDSSISDGQLKQPIDAGPGLVIEGWTEGVKGMKVGGVRELSIPASMAYGETGQGEDIPANTPIKFIMLVIPTPKAVEPSSELQTLYTRLYGTN